ncbi:unnamed protein product [Bursaphelenchus okinawaensis]|uniref:Uncharacterized protein n=1 Tax=Bursaphelenchus okinawaensis TaxID=465554 RepID=A0A811L9N0_9BILA|nr:unnamed protein product [Bursaphelenchus okinawaensis]CAG9119808.1 unnamed protein product [Bursaphelenchus okinawaensis]
MGFKDAIVSLVGDFVEIRRNPEFRSRTELSASPDEADEIRAIRRNQDRRHSLNITVGTSGASNEHVIRQRTFHDRTFNKNRRHSAVPKMMFENRSPSPDSETDRPEAPTPKRSTERRSSEPHNLRIPPQLAVKDRPLLSDSDSDTEDTVFRRSLNLRRRQKELRQSVALSEHTIHEDCEAEEEDEPVDRKFSGRTIISINH